MFQLAGKSGSVKGVSWVIGDAPLVIGRDLTCDVTVNDPIVSRRHCEFRCTGSELRLFDLGSSNATFVNGEPVKEVPLQAGDEIAVGNAIFLVTQIREGTRGEGRLDDSPTDTHSLRIGEPTYLSEDPENLFAKGKPRTAEDLAALFRLGRVLAQSSSVSGLLTALLEGLANRFSPQGCWVVLMDPEDDSLRVYPREEEGAFAATPGLERLVQEAVAGPRGILLPERWRRDGQVGVRTYLAAPMALGRECVGALVVRAETPHRMYDEGDLEFLLAMAHAAAPYLQAVERLEQLERENRRLMAGTPNAGPIIGTGRGIERVRALARTGARSDLNVIILGETGTGKELVARMIHDLSERADKPLVVVNCAAIPDELFESELFGHEPGAFTSAAKRRIGKLEHAHQGTLFLDEIESMPLNLQVKLLRVLQEKVVERLGSNELIPVDFRVVAATKTDLQAASQQGTFRDDLYYRLNVAEIHIPPLRDRREDIPLLFEHFCNLASISFQREAPRPSREDLQALMAHPWPGNVRELKNIAERFLIGGAERKRPLAEILRQSTHPPQRSFAAQVDAFEKCMLEQELARCRGNIKTVLKALGMPRRTLNEKMRKYGLNRKAYL